MTTLTPARRRLVPRDATARRALIHRRAVRDGQPALPLGDAPDEIEAAKQALHKFYAYCVAHAKWDAGGGGRVSWKRYAELYRAEHRAQVNNTHVALVGRAVLRDYPELAPHVSTRRRA